MPIEDEIMLDITDDMYCGSLSSDVVSEFICMLCYGIVYDPMKCSTCNNLVCKKCVNMKKLKSGSLSCFKKCGSKQFEELSNLESVILGSLVFRC